MKIFCDGLLILSNLLVNFETMNMVYHEKGSELLYIENSRTYDTLRFQYPKRDFKFTFTDRYNHYWEVTLEQEDDTVNMFIPCGTQMLWYGADESPTRTGSDAQTHWASVQFSYGSGVRIAFSGYKDKSTGEWKVDTERWVNILDLIKKGTEITKEVIDQIDTVVAPAVPSWCKGWWWCSMFG